MNALSACFGGTITALQWDGAVRQSTGDVDERTASIAEVTHGRAQLGAISRVEENGGYVIRGEGCPLSALTGKHPIVCQAMESLIEDIVGAPARQCCDRADRPRCCFHIGPPSTSRRRQR